jgi:hypothetical protein
MMKSSGSVAMIAATYVMPSMTLLRACRERRLILYPA